MKKRFLSILLVWCMALALLPGTTLESYAASPTSATEVHFERVTIYFQDQFSDVSANQWYTQSVADAFELGLMVGDSSTTFNPHGDVTIAEAVTMASRIYSIYTTGSANAANNAASPAGSAWYRRYLEYAYKNGIISYAYYNSDATQKANRAQFAEIFANALPAEALSAINTVKDDAIPDVKTSERYAEYVYRLYRAGILIGSDANGTFHPQTYITRAEAAAIVSRMAESDNRVSITLIGTPSQDKDNNSSQTNPSQQPDQDTDNNGPQTDEPQQPNTNTVIALADMNYFSGSSKISVSTNEKDSLGNAHSSCIMNDFDRTYMINGAYTKMSGVIFQEYGKRSDSVPTSHCKFEIYGDGKLLYSINFSSLDGVEYSRGVSGTSFTGFRSLDFNLDISRVTELRVVFRDGEAVTLVPNSDGPLALGDCNLYKDAQDQTTDSSNTPSQQQPQDTPSTAMLVDMNYFAGSSKIDVSTNEKDSLGNIHSDCIMNDFDRTYMINGAYTKMTGVIFQEYGKRSDSIPTDHCKFEVYGDGKLLYSINFSSLDGVEYSRGVSGTSFTGFRPMNFSIDIGGITELRVVFRDGEAVTLVSYSDGPLALGDCGLYS